MVSVKFYGVQGGFTKTALLGGNSQIAGQSPIKRLKNLNSLNVFSVKKKCQSLLKLPKKLNRLKENQNLRNMKGIDK